MMLAQLFAQRINVILQYFIDRCVGHAGITGCSDHVGYSFIEIVICHGQLPAWED